MVHGPSPIPTHQWGSRAIDRIFISSAIRAELTGGFLQFGEVTISDHRVVWLDVPAYLFEMAETQDNHRLAGWRLKCQDPWIIWKYNDYIANQVGREKLIIVTHALANIKPENRTMEYYAQWEVINQHITQIKVEAKCQCWKLHMGQVIHFLGPELSVNSGGADSVTNSGKTTSTKGNLV